MYRLSRNSNLSTGYDARLDTIAGEYPDEGAAMHAIRTVIRQGLTWTRSPDGSIWIYDDWDKCSEDIAGYDMLACIEEKYTEDEMSPCPNGRS
jgi:hypothetical protein